MFSNSFKITFKAFDLGVVITLNFEDWRFITEAVDDARDYRLITETVTQSFDYGSI